MLSGSKRRSVGPGRASHLHNRKSSRFVRIVIAVLIIILIVMMIGAGMVLTHATARNDATKKHPQPVVPTRRDLPAAGWMRFEDDEDSEANNKVDGTYDVDDGAGLEIPIGTSAAARAQVIHVAHHKWFTALFVHSIAKPAWSE